MNEATNLVKMVNQIAANVAFHEDAAERLADHLQRFWAPSMQESLARVAAAGKAELDPLVAEALEVLGR